MWDPSRNDGSRGGTRGRHPGAAGQAGGKGGKPVGENGDGRLWHTLWQDKPVSLPIGLPPDHRLYAIGDVHGRADLLAPLLEIIAEDLARARPRPGACDLVVLGDILDRGPHSRAVVELLLEQIRAADGRTHAQRPAPRLTVLRGNHEAMALAFLTDPETHGAAWMTNGGARTLESYGVAPPATPTPAALRATAAAFAQALPADHRRFLGSLPLMQRLGDVVLVHAGVRPGLALADQDPTDLLWIREPFLSSRCDFGALVIHGHSVTPAVEVRPNRIGVDTGAVHSGRLSCLVLEGRDWRVLSVG